MKNAGSLLQMKNSLEGKMKRKIIIISLVILPILITVIFSICGDPSKLRWYELDTI